MKCVRGTKGINEERKKKVTEREIGQGEGK